MELEKPENTKEEAERRAEPMYQLVDARNGGEGVPRDDPAYQVVEVDPPTKGGVVQEYLRYLRSGGRPVGLLDQLRHEVEHNHNEIEPLYP